MMKFEEIDGQVKMSPTETHMTEEEIKVSNELKAMFPQYLNSLNLKDDKGNPLTLDEEGNGSFKDYVLSFVAKSAEKELKDHESLTRHPAFLVRGSEVEKQDCFTMENDKVTAIDFDKFVSTITRMKMHQPLTRLISKVLKMKSLVRKKYLQDILQNTQQTILLQMAIWRMSS